MRQRITCEQCEGTGQYTAKVWGKDEILPCADCRGQGTAPADAYPT